MIMYTAIFKKEDVGYSVTFPSLDGCITEGDTKEEASTNAMEALALYLDTYMELNPLKNIPTDITASNIVLQDNDFTQMIEYKSFNKKLSPLAKRFIDYEGEQPELVDWGKPKGKEIW